MRKHWRICMQWLGLVGLLTFFGVTAGCATDLAVSPTLEPDGPALIVFYTDN